MTFLILGVSALFLIGYLWNHYDVWAEGKKGQAEVQRAEWSRRIATIEAHAKMESSKVEWLYFRGQVLYKDLTLKEYYHDKEKEYLFA